MTRPIVFLSDFGLADSYVGQVKAVMAAIAQILVLISNTG